MGDEASPRKKKNIKLTPKSDDVFKAIFGDQRHINILEAFLKAVFERSPIKIEISNLLIGDTSLKPDNAKERKGIVDILAMTGDGKTIDIEIQVADLHDMVDRTLFYGSKMITSQVTKKVKFEDRYKNIRPVIVVAIVDFKIENNKDYFNSHAITNLVYHNLYTEKLQIYTLELPKVPPKDDNTDLWTWLSFIKSKSKKQLEVLKNKIREVDEAMAIYNKFMTNDRLCELAEAREAMYQLDMNSFYEKGEEAGIKKGLKKGKAEGLKEGEVKKAIEVTKNLVLATQMPLEEAMKILKVDPALEPEIRKLLNQ